MEPTGTRNPDRSFRGRAVLPEFDSLPCVPGEAAAHVSEDRNRLIDPPALRRLSEAGSGSLAGAGGR